VPSFKTSAAIKSVPLLINSIALHILGRDIHARSEINSFSNSSRFAMGLLSLGSSIPGFDASIHQLLPISDSITADLVSVLDLIIIGEAA
jgi:hypothetical protein